MGFRVGGCAPANLGKGLGCRARGPGSLSCDASAHLLIARLAFPIMELSACWPLAQAASIEHVSAATQDVCDTGLCIPARLQTASGKVLEWRFGNGMRLGSE